MSIFLKHETNENRFIIINNYSILISYGFIDVITRHRGSIDLKRNKYGNFGNQFNFESFNKMDLALWIYLIYFGFIILEFIICVLVVIFVRVLCERAEHT